MRYQFRALQFSIAFHALMIIIVLSVSSSSFVTSNRVIFIDFTVGDTISGKNSVGGDIAKTNSKNNSKNSEWIPKVITSNSTLNTQVQISEEETPVPAYPESGDSQYKPAKAVNINYSTFTGDMTGGDGSDGKDTKLASNVNYKSYDSNVLSNRYLRESFSYIKDRIQKKITYPRLARQMGWEGKVTISFFISTNGFAKDVKVKQSSGFNVLDKSAIEAVIGASPFPEPPVEAQIIIPITYKLN